MQKSKGVKLEILIVGGGIILLTAAMLGIYAWIGRFDRRALYGALVGAVLSFLQFLLLVASVQLAANKAEQQDVNGAKSLLAILRLLRYVLLFGALILCALTKHFNPVTLALPVIFVQPALLIGELLRKEK